MTRDDLTQGELQGGRNRLQHKSLSLPLIPILFFIQYSFFEVGESLKNGSYEIRERFAISSSVEEAVEEKIGKHCTKETRKKTFIKVLRALKTVFSGWETVHTFHHQLPYVCSSLEMLTLCGTDIQSGNS